MSNSLYLYYFGHGGINGWAQERVLTTQEIAALIITITLTADFLSSVPLLVNLHFGMTIILHLQENN